MRIRIWILNKYKHLYNSFLVNKSGYLFQEDMIVTDFKDPSCNTKPHNGISARNGKRATNCRWPNNTVPYRFESNHTETERAAIESALREIASVSCVEFVPQTNEVGYVIITVSMIYDWSDQFLILSIFLEFLLFFKE